MSTPQFELFSHASGPNGWKVAFVLEALGLTYTTKFLDFAKQEQKAAEFIKLNPNGRIPAIIDHSNGDFTLWESNAIIKYLQETYDKENKLGVTDPKEKAQLDQWLSFQSSGQGPYYGQAAHFKFFAPEKIPYGVKRYSAEVARVLSVLDDVLAKQEYLVGGKLTIADISFIQWNVFGINALLPEDKKAEDFPHFKAWHEKLLELPYVKAVHAEKAKLG